MDINQSISFKNIHRIAIPALIAGIAEPILSLTDTAIIGNVGVNATEALAAVGIVGTFLSMLIWILGQTRSAISSLVSQYLGANKLDVITSLPAQAILIVTSLSFLIIIGTYPFAQSIFKLYNASGTILNYAVEYYNIRVFGFPFTLFTFAVFGVFRGLQNTFYPMIIAITGATVNIILDVILVYGVEGFIHPMHIKGAAYASVAAQLIMAFLAAYFMVVKTPIPLLPKLPFNPEIKRFALMIANLFVRTIALNIALFLGSSFATRYGNEFIAAYTIAINLWFLGAFMIDGYASAGNIISGKLLGAKAYNTLLKFGNSLIKYGIGIGLLLAVLGGLFYDAIGLIFTEEPLVLKEFYTIFWIVLAMQPLCALAFIFDGVFKGLGKMRYLRNVLLGSTFIVFVPVLLLLDRYDFKLYAIFIAFTLWILARGIPLIIKFNGTFKTLEEQSKY